MLKYRIITALFLIPIFLALLIKLSPVGFYLFTAAVLLWAAWEWSSFVEIKKPFPKFTYIVSFLLVMIGSLYIPIVNLLWVAFAWWILAFFWVLGFPKWSKAWGKNMLLRAIMGFFVLVPCWRAINHIRTSEHGVYTLLFLFVLIWGADIGAYFAGRAWGRHKLAPQVSPGKTWEGLFGALIVTLFISLSVLFIIHVPLCIGWAGILLCIVTVLFSVLGDLFESMMKRNVGLKDSGHLLPGHGGILDRIDSLTAAAPIFTLGGIFLGKLI